MLSDDYKGDNLHLINIDAQHRNSHKDDLFFVFLLNI